MSVLRIDAAGPATSVQDGGRFGFLRYGLSSAGAMDRTAHETVNALVGNAPQAPVVEIGPFPARFAAEGGPVRLAIAGSARTADIGDRRVVLGESFVLASGEVLTLGAARGGVFSYLGIAGGIAGTPMFGSFSVHARADLGSPLPRPLATGDKLEVAAADANAGEWRLALPPQDPSPIRVVLGPQDDWFGDAAVAQFLGAEWQVSPASDRMGYRLLGPKIAAARGHNIVSDGIALGQIQVPGDGQPLVLMADRGTTGGYPKIAAIVSADLSRFAQTPAGTNVRFAAVPIDEAQRIARAWRQKLAALPLARETAARPPPTSEKLLAANLAGAAVNALDPQHWTHNE
jgi:5-oxoprolinase (ATP-hydrolysing) subunit C